MCTSPTHSGISTVSQEESKLLRDSVQPGSGIRIWHSFYTLPEIIMPTSGVPLSNTFRYFYSWPGKSENTLESYFRPTVVLGFGIPYILYQKLLWLLLVCTSPTLSVISNLSQEWASPLSSHTISDIMIWHSINILPLVTVPTSDVHFSNTFRYLYF